MAKSVGNLFVRLSLQSSGYTKGLSAANKAANKTVRDLRGGFKDLNREIPFKKIAIGIMAAATSAAYLSVRLVKVASDAEEINSKFGVVFKDLSSDANRWAQEFGKSVGRANQDVKKWMATLQDTFVPLGYARDRGFELSKALVTLAVDVASFNNAVDDDVLRDFTSALVGNHETVRKYGIVITEAALKQEALRNGYTKNWLQLKENEKAQLRYNLILAGTADAQGDAIRTGDSYANQVKRMRANITNLSESIGNSLLPNFTSAIQMANDWVKANEKMIQQKADVALNKIGDAMKYIYQHKDALQTAIGVFVAGFAINKLVLISSALVTIGKALAVIGATPFGGALLAGAGIVVGGYGQGKMAAKGKMIPVGAGGPYGMAMPMGMYPGQGGRRNLPKMDLPFRDELPGGLKMLFGGAGIGRLNVPAFNVDLPSAQNAMGLKMQLPRSTRAGAAPEKPANVMAMEFSDFTRIPQAQINQNDAGYQKLLDDAQEYSDNIISLKREVKEQQIILTTTGFEQQRQLEVKRYSEEVESYNKQTKLIELAREKHRLNMQIIAQSETQQMIQSATNFAVYWSNALVSVVEQSGNSFANIARMFDQMIKKMVIRAAVAGFIGYILGGPVGAKAAATAAVGMPSLPSGSRGKSAVYTDQSSLTISIGEGARGMNTNEIARAVDDVIRTRKSAEFERLLKAVG